MGDPGSEHRDFHRQKGGRHFGPTKQPAKTGLSSGAAARSPVVPRSPCSRKRGVLRPQLPVLCPPTVNTEAPPYSLMDALADIHLLFQGVQQRRDHSRETQQMKDSGVSGVEKRGSGDRVG